MGVVEKRAVNVAGKKRPILSFFNARSAFKAFLSSLQFTSEDEVWLPAYIGWSSREGSGVFDPIEEVGVRYRFYRLDENLQIDLDYLRDMFRRRRPRLLVLIHYFGFPDLNLHAVVELAKSYDVLILEDEAHALYSDWIGNICGRYGAAAIMSLHKMLPFQSGGILQLNEGDDTRVTDVLHNSLDKLPLEHNLLDYDLVGIAHARRNNANKLLELLQPMNGAVVPLFTSLPKGVFPQTLPVRINGRSRDELYFELNARGFGVVSLYHTLIAEISFDDFPESHSLAKNILNLPVHQDIKIAQLEAMIAELKTLL